MSEENEETPKYSKEELDAKRLELGRTLKELVNMYDPEAFIDDWAVVYHADSIQMTAEGMSRVSAFTAPDQPFHRTTGLLTYALDAMRGMNQ